MVLVVTELMSDGPLILGRALSLITRVWVRVLRGEELGNFFMPKNTTTGPLR